MKIIVLTALVVAAFVAAAPVRASEEKIDVTITGGHDTDPRDRGRPVALVAGGLGVAPEVFREAFRQVKPAQAGTEPDPEQVRRNKSALMDALAKYGVTNDSLDRVSNRYRYRRDRDETWPSSPAAAYALVRDGKVVSVIVAKGGNGYSSPPAVTVPGHPEAKVLATLSFDKDLEKNGAVSALTIVSVPTGAHRVLPGRRCAG